MEKEKAKALVDSLNREEKEMLLEFLLRLKAERVSRDRRSDPE